MPALGLQKQPDALSSALRLLLSTEVGRVPGALLQVLL